MAQEYIKQKGYLWNAGIFIWSVSTIVNAFRVYHPEISRTFEKLLPIYDTPEEQERINELFPTCENISVDYAIMERAEEIFVYPGDFGWSDLGSWGSLREQVPQDKYGNACIGDNIDTYETHNCMYLFGAWRNGTWLCCCTCVGSQDGTGDARFCA